ncbi:plasmid maintenance system killer protein [Xanthomonas sp. JAI131]|nr:plasmid maintenance system killer protein [Xanthomonas sp. JAI131]
MIRNFVDKEADKIWQGTPSRRLPADIQAVARRKLRMLNSAATLDDLRVPPAIAWKR